MYLYREYFKAKVCTIWVHGPLGFSIRSQEKLTMSIVRAITGLFAVQGFASEVQDTTNRTGATEL